MGQLFDGVNRLVKSELNFGEIGNIESSSNRANALVAGGAIAGASVGKAGILVGGTGYAVGTIPLAALGALTGAALYEALRSLLEGDASVASTAAIGATVGAATSAAIGGVGVAAGGSAIGLGIASMAAGGAAIALGLVGLNRLFQGGIDPETVLQRAIREMEAEVINVRQAMLRVATSQKELQRHYNLAQAEVTKWEQRAQLALQQGNDFLVAKALNCKNTHSGIIGSLKAPLDRGLASMKNAEEKINLLQAKIAEAKIMRTALKEMIAEAKLNGQLDNITSQINTNSAMAAFERMEEKVLMQEARSVNFGGNVASELEKQFAALEAGSDVDDELLQMKTMLAGCSQPTSISPSGQISSTPHAATPVDEELETLRRQLNQ